MDAFPLRRWCFFGLALCLIIVGCVPNTPPSAPPPIQPRADAATPDSPTEVAKQTTLAQVEFLGKTPEDRPIELYLFGDPGDVGPSNTVLILGGIHGNEPTSASLCRELIAHLDATSAVWRDRCVAIVPETNPDGLARRLRTNSQLVDLNRNFPAANWQRTRRTGYFGGEAPADQPETQLLIALIDRLTPARILSVHSMRDPCNNYDGPAEALATAMAAHNGYPVKASIGYPTPGSLGSWAGQDRRIPIITLELPSREKGPASWAKNREALLAAIRFDDPLQGIAAGAQRVTIDQTKDSTADRRINICK